MATLQWWYLFERNNNYFSFIDSCRGKIYTNGEVHKHHIIPKYWFREKTTEEIQYCDSEENLISLSREDHIKAHELLYEIYKNPQDRAAVYMLQGKKEESLRLWRQLGADTIHNILKNEGITFWDSDFQKEMAKRSMARPDALEIRSKGGKVGGRNRNLNRVITKNDRYLFCYNDEPVLCILNCETGGDILECLHSYKETPLQRVSQLLNGTRKRLNGWSCTKLE